MGMLLKDKKDGGGVATDDNAVILSDILGTEDALGTMDFKVAGNREGITTFQLDIKCEGLTLETMKRALDQARVGRLHILDEMEKALSGPRSELPPTVPKVVKMKISEDSIGKVIGPGGRQIRALIEDFGLTNIDVEENGEVQLSGFDMEQIEKAREMIVSLTSSGGGGGRRGHCRGQIPCIGLNLGRGGYRYHHCGLLYGWGGGHRRWFGSTTFGSTTFGSTTFGSTTKDNR